MYHVFSGEDGAFPFHKMQSPARVLHHRPRLPLKSEYVDIAKCALSSQ